MLEIDPLFMVTPSRMVSRVRRDTRYSQRIRRFTARICGCFSAARVRA